MASLRSRTPPRNGATKIKPHLIGCYPKMPSNYASTCRCRLASIQRRKNWPVTNPCAIRYRGPLLKFGAVKGFLDGTVDAKTAAMFDPYVGGGTGIPMSTQHDLERSWALYDREGFQIRLHAIGDKAIHMALDSFEYAEKT